MSLLRRPLWLAALLGLLMTLLTAPARAADDPPFRDPSLPMAQRIDDLLGRLTLAEKVSMLHQYQPAIPRLGIGAFKTGTEALHGVGWTTNVDDNGAVVTARGTVFPQAVGLASTWDPALLKRVGSAVGDEARGYHAESPRVWSLNLWAPVVNLLRDPRWGRNEEGYSEDPTLTGALSIAYGSGMQGEDPDHLKTAPTLKHYLANNNEVRRDTTSSSLRPRVEQEYDQAAFKPAIAADAATGVMASYNLVNGRPATVNPDLNAVVRSWTERDLLNVTDAHAPNNLVGSQAYFPDLAHANAATLKAGLDSFTTDNTNATPTVTSIDDALAQGLITEADVDTAIRHILSIRFRLGEFDPGGGRYGSIGKDVVDSPEHRRLARTTAASATVLLKNARRTLPLSTATAKKVAVVGPLADTLYTDWYSGALPYRVTPLDGIERKLGPGGTVTGTEGVDRIALRNVTTGRYVTAGAGQTGAVLKEGATTAGATEQFDVFDWGQGVLTLRSAANGRYVGYNWTNFVNDQEQPNGWYVQQQFKLEPQDDGTFLLRYAGYETAYDWFGPNKYLAPNADGTLVLTTADQAARFARETVTSGVEAAVAAAKAADVAVVVVGSMPFINGREDHDRTDMSLAEGQEALVKAVTAANPKTVVVLENSYPTTINWEQEHVPAILWTTHAGAETGNALADVLFGDVNPAGRLPQTWYRSAADLPDILDYDIIKTEATYLYSTDRPLYAFGHGLSYTTFDYRGLKLDARSVRPGGTVRAEVEVTNTGRLDGAEVVQLYTHQRTSRVKQPVKQLRAFKRVYLRAGETKRVTLSFKVADLAFWDVTRNRWVVEKSLHDVMAGASSADIRRRATLEVMGETIPHRDLSKVTRAADFDDYRGVELVDETKAAGDAVGGTATGDWISFAGADLGAGATRLSAGVAATAPGRVEVRLGSPTGRLLGAADVPATGGVYSYRTVTAPLARAPGVHDVYLVFTGDLRIKDFSLTR
ncbi:glycoside hydrolase family 3 protein [Sphaerisporangium sp. TRM90804]|uniref:glycoside hydrolase family 3 protein n=1 Tax=Sphaerisporangium sp. TRM90804 TaxID=3031113 RepID=UPI002449D5EB|nr:glycoside hydrolase family 3 protein [Sphaerisporangium sp. TRM90804]MDH2428223.1 glycoside hydrolase family 3 C-terminal domain-containing protein [Sphaerisporangium sp. TRM90804]